MNEGGHINTEHIHINVKYLITCMQFSPQDTLLCWCYVVFIDLNVQSGMLIVHLNKLISVSQKATHRLHRHRQSSYNAGVLKAYRVQKKCF